MPNHLSPTRCRQCEEFPLDEPGGLRLCRSGEEPSGPTAGNCSSGCGLACPCHTDLRPRLLWKRRSKAKRRLRGGRKNQVRRAVRLFDAHLAWTVSPLLPAWPNDPARLRRKIFPVLLQKYPSI